MLNALDYTELEVKTIRDAARAGGLEALAAECDDALALRLPLVRVPAIQAVVEAWRAQAQQKGTEP